MQSFVLDPARGLLMQASCAPDGRISTKDRICRYRYRMFPCAIHTVRCHSQSTAYWQFLSRGSRPHLLRSALQTSQPFDMEASLRFREPHTPAGAKNNSADSLKNIQVFFQEKWTLGHGDAVFSALLCKLLSVVGFPLHLCVGQDRIRSNGA